MRKQTDKELICSLSNDPEIDRDLQAYDDAEAFYDETDRPTTHKFRVCSAPLNDHPDILTIQINEKDLIRALIEAMLGFHESMPNVEAHLIRRYDAVDWADARRKIKEDPQFNEQIEAAYWFFIRNLPKLQINLYELLVLTSIISPIKSVLDPGDEQGSFDRAVRKMIGDRSKVFQDQLKQMLRTRSSGRPKKRVTGDIPQEVNEVIQIARELMGNATGIDALPALKTIADKLNVTENALGKRLRNAGYPWTAIKEKLLNLPSAKNSH